jgi:hypothetical protein
MTMRALRISDLEPGRRVLAVDLQHVLAALGPRAAASLWRVRDVWALGDTWSELERLTEEEPVPGKRLGELARAALQVIDGVFSGFDPGVAVPWVIVEAMDSAFYVVRSADEAVLDAIHASFSDVAPYADPPL